MYNAPSNCNFCPRLAASRHAVVNGAGPLPSRVLVVAQNPGREEELQGAPLVGWSGRKLDYLAGLAGLHPGTYRKENVCRCRPPKGPKGDLPLKPAEIANCAPFLRAAIVACQPEIIVTLGAPALRWFVADGKLDQTHGKVQEVYLEYSDNSLPRILCDSDNRVAGGGDLLHRKVIVVPMYHPAAASPNRNPGLATIMVEDWTRLGGLLAGVTQAGLGNYVAVEEIINCPTAGPIAFDYETNDPTWHGTFQAVRAHPIGVSMATQPGEAVYWATEDVSVLKPILEDPTIVKVAHNAVFEYIVSRNCGHHPTN